MYKQKSNYGQWYLTFNNKYKKYEVRQIKDKEHESRISKNKEIFIGTYENALNYFGISHLDKMGLDNIINSFLLSIEYYQLGENTVKRTSAELYEKLIKLCSYKKYFVEKELREEIVLNTLKIANKKKMIKDDKIIRGLEEKDPNNKRLYLQRKFEEKYPDLYKEEEELWDLM